MSSHALVRSADERGAAGQTSAEHPSTGQVRLWEAHGRTVAVVVGGGTPHGLHSGAAAAGDGVIPARRASAAAAAGVAGAWGCAVAFAAGAAVTAAPAAAVAAAGGGARVGGVRTAAVAFSMAAAGAGASAATPLATCAITAEWCGGYSAGWREEK